VLVALCRSAGIKARYRFFRMKVGQNALNQVFDIDPLFAQFTEQILSTTLEAQCEVCIDGTWMPAHLSTVIGNTAAVGAPISRFGEQTMDWGLGYMIPGTLKCPESIPFMFGGGITLFNRMAPATLERTNVSLQNMSALGRKAIEDAGGIEAYDQKAREKMKLFSPVIEVRDDEVLVFEE
jgi:hypothetical protein